MKTPVRLPGTVWLRLHLGLAAIAYVPLLLTRPGSVSADTKSYLYLDPAQLLGRAWSMWDPSIGMGTVTHQTIGYLWPMGPFYWVADLAGIPDWATQRIWWGTIIFAAGAGTAYLLRTLGWRGPAVAVAAFVYALSPYVLTLIARLSVILLPFSALPWLVAFTIRTARTRGWRYPALFALTVATCGSVNATALLLVGVAPVIWLAHAVWVAREVPLGTALRAGLRIGVLTVPVSAWWIAGLTVQGTNGIEILRYTETAEVVAAVSTAHEVLRGLGYWFFYGTDRLGPWIEPSVTYTQFLPLLALTYLIPIAGLTGAVVARWRHRAYFVMLLAVGMALAVGAYPWEDGAPWQRAVKWFLLTDVGLSMRSLPRAVPLVALSLAVLLAAGIASAAARWPRIRRPAAAGALAAAVLAMPPLWTGRFVPDNLRRPEDIPHYWREAAEHLEAQGDDTRVLVLPGSDFASYRWGNTVDPVLPGLMDRPSVARELIPYGSAASANLLNALDLPLQERTADPGSLAPVARLMRAGHVLVQSDLQYERYNTPRPRNFWEHVTSAPGLGDPVGFGPDDPNVTIEDVQLEDELFFTTDPDLPDPPAVAVFDVTDPVPIVSTHASGAPLLVAGDGAGLVDAAAAGLLDGTELIRYAASLGPEEISAALDEDAALLVTDSNRKRGERWTTVRHTRGYTETVEGGPLTPDHSDNRLPVFPDAGPASMTVAVERGGIEANATSYGNTITFTSEERPALAVDGDTETAWRTAAFADARGERLELSLATPVTTDRVTLLQPTTGSRNRYLTEVELRFDGGDPLTVDLTRQSRVEPGQLVTFPERTFSTLSIEIIADTAGDLNRWAGQSSVGFAEVRIGEDPPTVDESIRVPTDLLDAAGADSIDHPLALSFTRVRHDPTDVTRYDEELRLSRLVDLPAGRAFSLTGDARLSARAPRERLDELLGRDHGRDVPWVRASSTLTGSLITPAAAFDGDPGTAWTSVRADAERQWIEVVLPEPATFDTLPLTVVADGHHSVPSEVEIWVDGTVAGRVPLPDIPDGEQLGASTTVDVPLPEEVTGSRVRVRFTGLRAITTNDWVSDREVDQPVAIAEMGLPGEKVPTLPDTFDTGCRDDLLEVDGSPVPVRIRGPVDDALDGEPLDVATCEGEAVELAGGEHELRTARGLDTALDIDRLVLRSAPGGEPTEDAPATLVAEAMGEAAAAADDDDAGDGERAPAPEVAVLDEDHDRIRARIQGATPGESFWLVLGQSYNDGWTAEADGTDLESPQLVDGFANGWRMVPASSSFEVEMRFAPQQGVDVALVVSAVAGVACLLLVLRRPRTVVLAPASMPEPYSPVLAFRYDGALPTLRTAWLTGLGMGFVAFALAGPLIGLGIGVAAGLGARHETFRRWLLLASPLALAVAALYVLYVQFRQSPGSNFDWPTVVRRPSPLGWVAVLALVADAVVDRVWQARRSDGG